MKKIFGLALIATLLSPMACTKTEEAPVAEEAAAPTSEEAAAPVTEEAAPAEAAPAPESH